MARSRNIPSFAGPPEVHSLEDVNAYEPDRQLHSAVVAAGSARIGAAVSEAAKHRRRRASVLAERQTLDPRDRERVHDISAQVPGFLAAVRAGAQ